MKITAGRWDDIARQRQEYDDETQVLENKYKERRDEYKKVLHGQSSAIEREIAEMIGPTSLPLEISVDPYGSYTNNFWSIHIMANDHRNSDDKVALVWNWDVSMRDSGEVVKDSGSWSGLKAVSAEQIADLKESVRVLEILNNADWATILTAPKANYEEYMDNEVSNALRDRKKARPAFEDDLIAAHLEDLVGSHTAVKLTDDPYWRGNVWMFVTGLTDKFVKGYVFPEYFITNRNMTADEIIEKTDERRVAKNKLVKDGKDELATLDVQ